MGMIGADPDALRALAFLLGEHGGEIGAIPTATDPEIEREELWRGDDADRFRADWQAGPSTLLPRLGERLEQLRDALEQQAAEQEACSADAGGARGVGADGAPGAGGGGDAPGDEGGDGRASDRGDGGTPGAGGDVGTPAVGGDGAAAVERLRAIDDPAARRSAWEAMTPEERQAAIEADPSGIGNLDGIPLADRASANQAAAQGILDRGGEGISGADLEVVKKVASGEIQAVLFEPHKGDIVQMLGTPGPGTTHSIIWAPPTNGRFHDLHDGGYLDIPRHLAQMHPDAVVFIYQRGDWSEGIADVPGLNGGGTYERFSNDPAVAAHNGRQVAEFQRQAIGTDPYLAGAQQVGMGFSYGNSVVTAAEQAGARFEKVVSVAGANMDAGWRPNPGTQYANYQYSNDMLNIPQGMKGSPIPGVGPLADVLMPGQVPDTHPVYSQHNYGDYGVTPLITVPTANVDTWFGPITVPTGLPQFDERGWDPGEAHANISKVGPTNAQPVKDMEEFLFR